MFLLIIYVFYFLVITIGLTLKASHRLFKCLSTMTTQTEYMSIYRDTYIIIIYTIPNRSNLWQHHMFIYITTQYNFKTLHTNTGVFNLTN